MRDGDDGEGTIVRDGNAGEGNILRDGNAGDDNITGDTILQVHVLKLGNTYL